LKVVDFIFLTTTPTPSRRRKGFDFDDESMFFDDVGH